MLLLSALIAALVPVTLGPVPAGAVASPTAGSGDWTVYHGDPTGNGVDASGGSYGTTAAWTSPSLDGQLYGQPLVSGGRVYVATEDDTVVALDASNGRTAWSSHLGTAVPASDLPCGDIQPTVGVTGTPVLDPSRGELFVVADELVHGAPGHLLVGLDASTGSVELTQTVDPPGADPAALLQRTGLALDSGRIVFGFGGNYGDCGAYHGWVVSVPEAGGAPLRFEVDAGSGQREGAVWMGGAAPVVGNDGNVWVSVGNGSVVTSSGPYDNSDSVLELSPSLALLQYFAPARWAADNAADLDLSVAPALLDDGLVVAAGKSQTAYLLQGTRLAGIGGQLASLATGCGDDLDGGVAFAGSIVYLPCVRGPIAVQVSTAPPGLREVWRATVGGGPPIVAGGRVWTVGSDGFLYGLDPTTGQVLQRAQLGIPANHFPTPGIGDGLLLAASADQVVAFPSSTTSSPASSLPAVSTTRPVEGHEATVSTQSGIPVGAIAAVAAGGLLVVGAAVWLVTRRRRRGGPPAS